MYNTLFGMNNMAKICLLMIHFDINDIPRFRDAICKVSGKHHVVEVLTRTGGSNRGCFDNRKLLESSLLEKEFDDKYDNTYRHFIFKVDEEYEEQMNWEKFLADQSRNSLNLREMFKKEFKEMKMPGTDANKRAEQMARGLKKLINENSGDEIKVISPDQILKMGQDTEDK